MLESESGLTPAMRSVRAWPGGFISAQKDTLTVDIIGIGAQANMRLAYAALLTKTGYQNQMEGFEPSTEFGELPDRIDVSVVLRGLSPAEIETLLAIPIR